MSTVTTTPQHVPQLNYGVMWDPDGDVILVKWRITGRRYADFALIVGRRHWEDPTAVSSVEEAESVMRYVKEDMDPLIAIGEEIRDHALSLWREGHAKMVKEAEETARRKAIAKEKADKRNQAGNAKRAWAVKQAEGVDEGNEGKQARKAKGAQNGKDVHNGEKRKRGRPSKKAGPTNPTKESGTLAADDASTNLMMDLASMELDDVAAKNTDATRDESDLIPQDGQDPTNGENDAAAKTGASPRSVENPTRREAAAKLDTREGSEGEDAHREEAHLVLSPTRRQTSTVGKKDAQTYPARDAIVKEKKNNIPYGRAKGRQNMRTVQQGHQGVKRKRPSNQGYSSEESSEESEAVGFGSSSDDGKENKKPARNIAAPPPRKRSQRPRTTAPIYNEEKAANSFAIE